MGLLDNIQVHEQSREYQLFISHAWDYRGDYDGVVNLLRLDRTFRWKDLSVTEDRAIPNFFGLPKSNRFLVHELDARIAKADCLLVLHAMYANHRAWIQSEIEAAKDFKKPIITIAPNGQERFPVVVTYTADERVCWRSASIIKAIRDLVPAVTPLGALLQGARRRYRPSSSARAGAHSLSRSVAKCISETPAI